MPLGSIDRKSLGADAGQLARLLLGSMVGALLLQWPLLVYGKPNVFMEDSIHYVKHGQIMWDRLGGLISSMLQAAPESATASGGGSSIETRLAAATGDVVKVRSIPYALFAGAAYSTPLGALAMLLTQTTIVLFCFGAVFADLVGRVRPATVAAVLLIVACTTLPFYATYMMPDTLAAVIVLYAILICRGTDHLGPLTVTVLVLAAAFTTISHHGFLPLAVVMIGTALSVLTLFGRLTWLSLALGIVPIVLPMLLNLGGSAVAFGESSVAPRRMPFVITRSITDGPARWHLEEHCATEQYHICSLFKDGIPEQYGQIMWGERGLAELPLEDLEKIRAEEGTIVVRAFLEYPVHQTAAFLERTFVLLPKVSVDHYITGSPRWDASGSYVLPLSETELIPLPDWARNVQRAVIVGSVVALLWLFATGGRALGSMERRIILVLGAGMVLNALVFGGLSAVDPRYQTRIGWLIPACALALVLARAAGRRGPSDGDTLARSLSLRGAGTGRAEP